MAKFSETVYLDTAPQVDPDKGVLKNVKLLGMESRNKRHYKPAAMKEAVSLYKGRKIYVDHPKRVDMESGADRSMNDWAGTIQNARFESDGIYGDVKLRKASPYFAGIIEAAQEFPKDVGFSHVADGESKYEGETEIVESIREVFSVDLVTDPATTGGFFESVKPTKKNTVKHAVESLPEGPVRKRLLEMMDGGLMDGSLSMASEEPADPLAQSTSIIKELIRQLGDALKALASKPAPQPASPPPALDAPEDEMQDEQTEKPADEKPAAPSFESVQRELAEEKAKNALLESGREATAVRIKALANVGDEDRKALLESWPQLEAGERPLRSPALLESEDIDLTPSDPKRYAASLR